MSWFRLLYVFLPNWRFFGDTRPTAQLEVRGPLGEYVPLPRPNIRLLSNEEHHLWLLTQGLAHDLENNLSVQLLAHTLRDTDWRVTLAGEVIGQSS